MTEAQIAELSVEDQQALALSLSKKISLNTENSRSKEEMDDLFTFVRLALRMGDHENAGKVFKALQPICHQYFDEGNDPETAIDYLIEWSLLAIGITLEKPDQFVSMPVYHDLLDVMDAAPEAFQYKRGRVYLQMATHFRQWQAQTGVADDLDAEDLNLLQSAEGAAEEVMDEFLAMAEGRGKLDEVIAGHRALLRYFLLIQKPNDAVAQLKAIMEVLPQTPDYHPAQLAETQILLGQLFTQFSKWQTARKYFDMAREVFEELGEEFEMNMYQAEGWIEECERHL